MQHLYDMILKPSTIKAKGSNWVIPNLGNSKVKQTGLILKLGNIEAEFIGLCQNYAIVKHSEPVLFFNLWIECTLDSSCVFKNWRKKQTFIFLNKS